MVRLVIAGVEVWGPLHDVHRDGLLVADTQLYKRLCRSVGPSVGPLVRWCVRPSVTTSRKVGKRAFSKLFVFVSELERGLGGALGVDGGWLPLPTRPQRYCDPASLVLF